MFFRRIALFLMLVALFGCDLREDTSLPSGVSPFDLFDDAIYIIGDGLYVTSQDSVYLRISKSESAGFEFVTDSYDFIPTSLSYNIEFVDIDGELIEVEDFLPLLAFPSEQFSYLGLKYLGDYERFYPYPSTFSITGYDAYYEKGFCYFLLSDSGYYQTVYDTKFHSDITVEIDTSQTNDINLSLYQAQFVLPRNIIPLGVQQIELEKIESDNLADYKLTLSDLPVNFNMIEDNPEAERYPILYIPIPANTETSNITVKQILPNNIEKFYTFKETFESTDDYIIYGNTIILFVNNQGEFIIN